MGNCSSKLLTSNQTFRSKRGGFNVRECFHMTSRRPYWCPKTIKRRPCWCSKPILWELHSFLVQTLSFVSINLHRCWPRYLAITYPSPTQRKLCCTFCCWKRARFCCKCGFLQPTSNKKMHSGSSVLLWKLFYKQAGGERDEKIILINYQPL